MNGITLYRVSNAPGISTHYIESGEVEYVPKIKYRIEKKNPFDPRITHKRDMYHEDTFNCEAVLQPWEYKFLMDFLLIEGIFYLDWSHFFGHQQYEVKVLEYPKCPDELNEYPERVKFVMQAIYVDEVHPPGAGIYSESEL